MSDDPHLPATEVVIPERAMHVFDRAISEAVHEYTCDFVRHGDPDCRRWAMDLMSVYHIQRTGEDWTAAEAHTAALWDGIEAEAREDIAADEATLERAYEADQVRKAAKGEQA